MFCSRIVYDNLLDAIGHLLYTVWLMKEREYGAFSAHHHDMLRAFVRGNALLPQINMGVHISMGHELVQKPPESFIATTSELPYMDNVVVAAMNAQHKRHGVRQFDEAPVRAIYSEFYWDMLCNTHILMGRGKVLTEQSLRGMAHLLQRDTPERQRVGQTYAYLYNAMQSPVAQELAGAYRGSYREDDRYGLEKNQLRHALVRELIESVVAGWPQEEYGYDAPFRYRNLAGDGRPGALVFSPIHTSADSFI